MTGADDFRPRIFVLAGTNGAGKSSVGGARFRLRGGDYFNPDEATRQILAANPGCTLAEANIAAWTEGKRLLEAAIAEKRDFAFETTLGGNTIASLLERAAENGLEVAIWYVGLKSPELHLERVRERVGRGGHDIPEARIRERYDRSRLNLIRLLPKVAELRLFDNSVASNPAEGAPPRPTLILHVARGEFIDGCALDDVPDWAKPIVAAAVGRG